METSGLDPEITICKIVVLPVKLCPLIIIIIYYSTYIVYIFIHIILFKQYAI